MKHFKIIVSFLLTAVMFLGGCSMTGEPMPTNDHLADSEGVPVPSDATSDPADSPYTVLTCDFSDSISGATLTREFETEIVNINKEDIPKSETVKINGQQRNGTFSGVEQYWFCNYYEFDYDNETLGDFRVDEDGNLTMCRWKISSDNELKLSQEECLQIANDFLADRIDLEQYQMKVKHQEKLCQYEFTFRKHIGEFETMDMAWVIVKENGELSYFDTLMLGRIPSDTKIDYDQEKATASVYAKLDALYAPVKDEYTSIEYELDPFQVTILENGETVLRCMVTIECQKPFGEYVIESGDRLELIIRNEA